MRGPITTHYGGSTPFQARHEAVDIACDVGTPIRAMKDGRVSVADWAVPGHLEAKVEHYLRALPKELRRGFVPLGETAKTLA